MRPDFEAFVADVALTIKDALAPVCERLAAAQSDVKTLQCQLTGLDARWHDLSALRERVAVMEAKAAVPLAEAPRIDLAPVLERVATSETKLAALVDLTKDVGALRERVAVVETRPLLPGPAGEPGAPGKDGAPGAAGLSFEGVYQEGKSYDVGHLTTWAGSSWHCNEPTTTKPGEGSKAWTLMVKRGRDGKDGHDGRDLAPVVSVGGAR